MTTFAEYYEENIERIWHSWRGREIKPKHKREADKRVCKFMAFNGNSDRNLDKFKKNDLFLYMAHLSKDADEGGEGLSQATVNRHRAAILKVFNDAFEEREMRWRLKVDKYEEPEGRRRTFTDVEVKKIINYLRSSRAPHMADMALLSYHTGMRLGEICQIGYSAEYYLDADGDPVLHLPTTKNGDSRDVYLNDEAAKCVANLKGLYSYFSATQFYNVWGEMKERMGIKEDEFTFHVFRHTNATYLANELNLNAKIIMTMLGHRNLKTTQRYIKSLPESQKAAVKLIPPVAHFA